MRLGFDRLWLWLALALPALVALLVPLPAVDLAYQLRAGEAILRTAALPGVDTWTFTVAGTTWTDQQWLAQVILAAVFRVGGWELLAVLRAVLVAGAVGLLAAASMARGASARTAAILSLVAFALAAPALALRPQLLAIVLFAVMLLLIARRDRWPRAYWLAPVLVILWANVHGSFVLAPVVLGYAWLDDLARGRPARDTLLVLVAGTVATLVNPFGPGVWAYAVGIGANPEVAARATEWQRTTPFTVPGLLFYASVVGVAAVALVSRSRLRWPDALLLLAMAGIGAWAVRGVAWWPFAAAFVAAAVMAPEAGGERARARMPRPNAMNGAVAVILGFALVAALPWWRPADPLTGRKGLVSFAPSGIALALREHVPAGTRVYVPQAWASWFEWADPDYTYLMDSRFELFPAEVWADEATIAAGGLAASAVLGRWQLVVAVVPAGGTPPGPGWSEGYHDADGTIYVLGVRYYGWRLVPSDDGVDGRSSAIVGRPGG